MFSTPIADVQARPVSETFHPQQICLLDRLKSGVSNWHLHQLGTVRVSGNGLVYDSFGTVRSQKLLVLLSLSSSGAMSRQVLAEQLWPDDYYDASRLRLRQELYRLKSSLGDASEILWSTSSEVGIDKSKIQTDIQVIDSGCEGTVSDQLLELFQLEFLPGWDDPWVTAERTHIESKILSAAKVAASQMLETGDAKGALAVSDSFIKKYPVDEELRMIAVRALAKTGSMSSAVAQYQDYRRRSRESSASPQSDLDSNDQLPSFGVLQHSDWGVLIPAPIDTLYGREGIVSQILGPNGLLRNSRLTVLTGPGGIGKTSIAIELANRIKAQNELRVAYVSFADTFESSDWCHHAIGQLGIDIPSQSDTLKFLGALLGEQPTVLFLDGIEAILPEAAKDLQSLIVQAPSLRIIATSIISTQLELEKSIAVGPINPEVAGYELLFEGLQRFRSAAISSSKETKALREIAVRLDGYPLSLRVAASRLRFLSPSDLLSQLEKVTTVRESADLPARHRTLESALDSSYSWLSENQQKTLCQLWPFPHGIGMDLASRYFEGTPFLDTLESLLDSSFVVLDESSDPVRVRLLAPIRSFVDSKLSATEKERLLETARAHIFQFAKETNISVWKPLREADLARLETESLNLIAAFNQACEQNPKEIIPILDPMLRFESQRGRANKLIHRVAALRHVWQDQEQGVRIDLDLLLAHTAIACHQEDLATEPIQAVQESLSHANSVQIAKLALVQAMSIFRRDFSAAAPMALEAAALSHSCGESYLEARAHRLLGQVYNFQVQTEKSLEHLSKAYVLFESVGGTVELGTLGVHYGAQLWVAQRVAESERILGRSKEIVLSQKDPVAWAFLYEIEGRIALDAGTPKEAEEHFQKALQVWQAIGSPYQEADQLHSLTKCFLAQDKVQEAKIALVKAADGWTKDDNLGGICCSLTLLARILSMDGKVELARSVILFAKDLEAENSLAIVQPELDLRSQLEAEIGIGAKHEWEPTLAHARKLFDHILVPFQMPSD